MANEFKARFMSGIQGPPGPWFTPTVSEDGTLSWTNNGGFTNPPDVFLGLHDGSVTDAKLADDLKLDQKTLFLGQGSDLDLEDHCIMYLSDPGYGAVEGICAIDDSHIVVGRYKSGYVRDLMVYNLDTRRVVASNVFDPDGDDATRKVALGHLNNLSYSDGYIYCGRVESSSSAYYQMDRIFKLAVDPNTYSITYADEYALSGSTIYWEGDYCYWFSGGNSTPLNILKRRTIGGEIEELFETDWPARVGIGKFVPQGLHMDEDFVYRAASGVVDVESLSGQTDYQIHTRCTEKIIIMRRSDGAVVRTLTFPRGSCGEVEDLTTVTKNGSKYLLISTNQNNYGVACVYAIPFTASDTSTVTFERSRTGKGLIDYGSVTTARNGYRVYCDNRACYTNEVYDPLNANPFATGLTQDRFTSFYAALLFCQRAGGPVHLYLTGTYAETLNVRGINGIHFILNSAIINLLDVRETSMYLSAISGQTNKIGQLYVEHASIISNACSALTFDKSLGSPSYAIQCLRSIIVGGFGAFTGYSTWFKTLQGFISIGTNAALGSGSSYLDSSSLNGFVAVNGRPEMLGGNYSTSATLTLSGKSASHTIRKYEKTVSFGIALGDGTAFSSATGNDSLGTVPDGYRPAATVLAAGIVSTGENGAGTATAVTIRITTAGAISLIGDADAIKAAKYLYASIAYLTT